MSVGLPSDIASGWLQSAWALELASTHSDGTAMRCARDDACGAEARDVAA